MCNSSIGPFSNAGIVRLTVFGSANTALNVFAYFTNSLHYFLLIDSEWNSRKCLPIPSNGTAFEH